MSAAPRKELSLFDSTCIIVGIIIGASIYMNAPLIAKCMGGWPGTLGIWLAGGLLALLGGLCYAELATAYPFSGGDYVYLTRSYGRWAGFLFGWTQLMVIRPGDIALMAFTFATYAVTLFPFACGHVVYAAGAIVVLTVINILGVKEGKWTQNVLTVVKALGLLAIVAAALLAANRPPLAPQGDVTPGGVKLALLLVLFAFGGWNEMAYVAAEVKRPETNIVRALVIGTVAVTVLYVLVNGAFLFTLGYEKMAASEAVATDTVATVLPKAGGTLIGILICVSALGALNGMVFTGARISYAMGTEHALFRGLGRWNPRLGTPVGALAVQGALSLVIVLVAGSFVDTILYTAPAVWVFFLGTGVSLFVLRRRDRHVPRPWKVAGYPLVPILFCACCLFMLYSSVSYSAVSKPYSLVVLAGALLGGAVLYRLTRSRDRTGAISA